MMDIWPARVYFLVSFALYAVVGRYIDLLISAYPLYFPSHYDYILELIPVMDFSILESYGLLFVYAAIAVCVKSLNSETAREFWIMAGTLLIIRTAMCLGAGFGQPLGYFIPDSSYPFFYNWLPRYDFFFSGHTAAPFFCFLFFEGRLKKIFFLILTVVMAITVLLLHHHYVIDVIAAPVAVWAVYSFFKFLVFSQEKGGKNEKENSGRYRSVRFHWDSSGR